MPLIDPNASTLLLIDFQARLAPAIEGAAAAIANAGRLIEAAKLIGAPMAFTEQNPRGLGAIVPELVPDPKLVVAKMSFDATDSPELMARLPADHAAILAGFEAHVCVLQTALGLMARGRRVFVVADASGSRRPESKAAGLARMERNGAEAVTTEMVVFEWLKSAEHPAFRAATALIK